MRRIIATGAFAFLFTMTAYAQTPLGVRASLDYYFPGDDDTWNEGLGADAQLVFWTTPEIGIGLGVGYTEWEAASFASSGQGLSSNSSVSAFTSGDATMIPFGVSLFYRPELQGDLRVTMEFGIRYVVTDSAVKLGLGTYDGTNFTSTASSVDIDDAVVGRIGADISWALDRDLTLFLGVGYQFDISEGEATWLNQDLFDNELKAAMIHGGLIWGM